MSRCRRCRIGQCEDCWLAGCTCECMDPTPIEDDDDDEREDDE